MLWANRCSHLSSSSLACSCSTSGHSSMSWRFNSSRIHPFQGPQADPPRVSIGRATGGTWFTGATLPTVTLVGTLVEQALSPSGKLALRGNPGVTLLMWQLVPQRWAHAGSASTLTHMQCLQMPVLPCMVMVPNSGMVTLWVVWTGPWRSCKQNSQDAAGLEPGEGVTPFPLPCSLWVTPK